MIDQSFSVNNLVKIFNEQNDKGNNLVDSYFPQILVFYDKSHRIKKLIWKLYNRRRYYSSSLLNSRVHRLYEILRIYNSRKDELIDSIFESISATITKNNFVLDVKRLEKQINKKDIYSVSHCVFSFFAEKQIQKNIKQVYGVKQADRDVIIPQIIATLKDNLPKVIVKTDIKSFYESIDKSILIRKINHSPLLSLQSRKILAKLVKNFDGGISSDKGIPRGVGVSAYISELYLKDFDDQIKNTDGLIYYSRYVDDIVAIYSPSPSRTDDSYLANIRYLLSREGLDVNPDHLKTKSIQFKDSITNYDFEYLGYEFKRAGRTLKVKMSSRKWNKYKEKIDLAFLLYDKSSKYNSRKAASDLILRIKFLTSNTKLSNNKSNAFVGIFNANRWISEQSQLTGLDNILQGRIAAVKDMNVRRKLKDFSFLKGFTEKKYSSFSIEQYKIISRAWNNI